MFCLLIGSTALAQGGAGSSGGGGGGGNSAGIKITPYFNLYIIECSNQNRYVIEKTTTLYSLAEEASVRNRARELCSGM